VSYIKCTVCISTGGDTYYAILCQTNAILFLRSGLYFGNWLSESQPTVQEKSRTEEFTGTWCGFCPRGANALDSIRKHMGDTAVILCWHYNDNMALAQENILDTTFGSPGYPTAVVDRLNPALDTPVIWTLSDNWYQAVLFDALTMPLMNIAITHLTFNPTSRSVTFSLAITPVGITIPSQDAASFMTVAALTEDSIIADQQFGPDTLEGFRHDDVVRSIGGSVMGDRFDIGDHPQFPVLIPYQMTVASGWNLSRIRVKAFVALASKLGHGQFVLNADQSKGYALSWPHESAVSARELPTTYRMSHNYPNPFNREINRMMRCNYCMKVIVPLSLLPPASRQ